LILKNAANKCSSTPKWWLIFYVSPGNDSKGKNGKKKRGEKKGSHREKKKKKERQKKKYRLGRRVTECWWGKYLVIFRNGSMVPVLRTPHQKKGWALYSRVSANENCASLPSSRSPSHAPWQSKSVRPRIETLHVIRGLLLDRWDRGLAAHTRSGRLTAAEPRRSEAN